MKLPDEDPLLNAVLTDDKLSDLRRASLDQSLDAMRHARRRRQMLRAGALAILPLVVLLTMLLPFKTAQKDVRSDVSQVPHPTVAAAAAPRIPSIKTISDDELFALFPDRSVALIGKPGHQELVFLDAPTQD
jgi:hypothetical protein